VDNKWAAKCIIVFKEVRDAFVLTPENLALILPYVLALEKDESSSDIKFQEIYRGGDKELQEALIELRPKAAEDMVYLELREKYIVQQVETFDLDDIL